MTRRHGNVGRRGISPQQQAQLAQQAAALDDRLAQQGKAVDVADTGIRAQDDYVGDSAYGEYANNVGPQLATRELPPAYQRRGRGKLAGYLNNPLEEQGREAIAAQFWHAPLGGHARRLLEGQELFGHTVSRGQARVTEQVLAAALASGIGVPTFLAGVQGLFGGNEQSAGTMPL